MAKGWDSLAQVVAPDGRVLGDKTIDEVYCAGERIRWFRHPLLFIPPSIKMWIADYDYCGDNYSVVPSHERHNCWVECLQNYKHYMELFSRGREN